MEVAERMSGQLPNLQSRIEELRRSSTLHMTQSVPAASAAPPPSKDVIPPHRMTFRLYARELVTSGSFSSVILGVIMFNTILIALQTDVSLAFQFGYYFEVIDNILLGIYIWELVLKVYALGFSGFCASGWNLFDAFIVLTSLVEPVMTHGLQAITTAFDPQVFRLLRVFRAFRALRALRVLRSISFLKNLQIIVSTLLRSIPAMGSIGIILFLVLYIWAIIGVSSYKDDIPERFGSMSRAMFALFQLITLDDWYEYFETMRTKEPDKAGTFALYLVVYIVLETFIFINLVIAVIVNNLERAQHADTQGESAASSVATPADAMPQSTDSNNADDAQFAGREYFGKLGKYGTMTQTERRRRVLEAKSMGVGGSFKGGSFRTRPSAARQGACRTPGVADDPLLYEGEQADAVELQNIRAAQEERLHEASAYAGVRDVERYYGSTTLSVLEKQRMADYFRIAASVESNLFTYHAQQKTLDDLVDVANSLEGER